MPLKQFSTTAARPLPVILLADVSGSMSDHGKIDALNKAVSEMVNVFSDETTNRAEIHVAVVTFGDDARLHQPLTPAREVSWTPMSASGSTPLGAALTLATDMLENPEVVPSRAYRPTLILVSDGMPKDAWQAPLQRLLESPRASKAFRFAMGIGPDADLEMLRKFLNDPEAKVFQADDARHILEFFKFVTMSVVSRSRSATPNQPPPSSTFVKPSVASRGDDDLSNLTF